MERKELIDVALTKASWKLRLGEREFSVTTDSLLGEPKTMVFENERFTSPRGVEVTDFALLASFKNESADSVDAARGFLARALQASEYQETEARA